MRVMRRVAIVAALVGVLPLLFTIYIAWSNDNPTTLLGLARSVLFWQAFFWAGSLLMAFILTLAFLVRTGRIVVVAGDGGEISGVEEYSGGSEIGIHPVTGNVTVSGIDVVTGYSTASYPSSTVD